MKVGITMNSLKNKWMQFMRGAYGVDRLGRFLVFVLIITSVINIFFNNIILTFIYLSIFIVTIFRIFSKNYAKRSRENQQFLKILKSIKKPFINGLQYMKDFRSYKYFKCPTCKTTIRIPRKKGTIMIRCPKCKASFSGKS